MHTSLSRSFIALSLLSPLLFALTTEDRILMPNRTITYLNTPGEAQSIAEIFTKGQLYGRLRSNNFVYNYDDINQLDNEIYGIGGSLTYKTAFYHGFGATAGFYASIPLGKENITCTKNTCVNYTQAGKDLFRVSSDGSENAMGVLAVGYGEWKNSENSLKIGRQIVDTVLLGSNDAKMVPNTFEGVTYENHSLESTLIEIGYLTSQKLRNHQTFHSILEYAPRDGNDDRAAHKGLSISKLETAHKDINPEMLFTTVDNNSIKNLQLHGEYIGLSSYFSTLIAEANYAIYLNNEWTLTPGVRYLQQMDHGAGAVGGAALSGSTKNTYTQPNSLDGSLVAARIRLSKGAGSVTLGYSDVANKADIVAPWRGFPTGGYTRAMAQTNWYANTKSWMINGSYDFNKAQIISGLLCTTSYSHINIDDAKSNALSIISSDRDIIYTDAIQTFSAIPNTEFKFRFANVDAKTINKLPNTSYQEYRFEINYLF
jgi:hypothetical protein